MQGLGAGGVGVTHNLGVGGVGDVGVTQSHQDKTEVGKRDIFSTVLSRQHTRELISARNT